MLLGLLPPPLPLLELELVAVDSVPTQATRSVRVIVVVLSNSNVVV